MVCSKSNGLLSSQSISDPTASSIVPQVQIAAPHSPPGTIGTTTSLFLFLGFVFGVVATTCYMHCYNDLQTIPSVTCAGRGCYCVLPWSQAQPAKTFGLKP